MIVGSSSSILHILERLPASWRFYSLVFGFFAFMNLKVAPKFLKKKLLNHKLVIQQKLIILEEAWEPERLLLQANNGTLILLCVCLVVVVLSHTNVFSAYLFVFFNFDPSRDCDLCKDVGH